MFEGWVAWLWTRRRNKTFAYAFLVPQQHQPAFSWASIADFSSPPEKSSHSASPTRHFTSFHSASSSSLDVFLVRLKAEGSLCFFDTNPPDDNDMKRHGSCESRVTDITDHACRRFRRHTWLSWSCCFGEDKRRWDRDSVVFCHYSLPNFFHHPFIPRHHGLFFTVQSYSVTLSSTFLQYRYWVYFWWWDKGIWSLRTFFSMVFCFMLRLARAFAVWDVMTSL